jgi:hypothetical protein
MISERVVMAHDRQGGQSTGGCVVVLCDESRLDAAVTELQSAPLFDCTVLIDRDLTLGRASGVPDLSFGWLASNDPDPVKARARGPLIEPPIDIW